jgi:hypothetical protein
VVSPFQLAVETHPFAATVYLSGPFSLAVAARTIAACCRLPRHVRAIRVDLHAVTVWHADAVNMLESLLVEWARERRGTHCITPTRSRPRDAFVAIPCTIRDAPDSPLRPGCDDRVFSTPPNPAMVT